MIEQINLMDEEDAEEQLLKKIILLYLLEKFDMPLASARISQFAQAEAQMNLSKIEIYLDEMVEIGYLEKSLSSGISHYAITGDGSIALETFLHIITNDIRTKVSKFVDENRRAVKEDFSSTANFFYDKANNEFIVKCGVYENDMTLMELSLSVIDRAQALGICANWRENVTHLYGDILTLLMKK